MSNSLYYFFFLHVLQGKIEKGTGNSLGVSGHRSGVTGQRKGNTDGSAGAETELHSQSSEDKHSPTGVIKI